jgi:hypothetical protein
MGDRESPIALIRCLGERPVGLSRDEDVRRRPSCTLAGSAASTRRRLLVHRRRGQAWPAGLRAPSFSRAAAADPLDLKRTPAWATRPILLLKQKKKP